MRSIVIIELLDGSSTSFAKQTAGSIVRRLDTWRREDSERQSSTGGQEDSGEITTESTIRKKYDVPSMWGNIRPRWRLLQQHLETKGPGWYPLAEREEWLFTNRSNRPGDDMKDELRTDSDPSAWSTWRTSQNQLWQLRQPAPPLEFPGEQGMLTNMHAQVREEEQVISLQFIGSQQDVSMGRRKKRKQVDDGTAIA